MELQPIFSSFLVADYLEFNPILRQDCIDAVSEANKNRNDNISQSSFLDLNDYRFTNLLKQVECRFNELHSSIGLDPNVQQILSEYWININLNSKIQFPHSHPNRAFSAVYYVSAGEDCGDIVFLNPNKVLCQNFSDDCIEDYNEFTATHWKITPKDNLLIIFPSWLEHYVQPNNSNVERISIAFNSRMLKSN
jgi:uncharacterized protein (TIGR02466 family)